VTELEENNAEYIGGTIELQDKSYINGNKKTVIS